MTVGSILIYVALIGYIGYRRVQGQPVKASRQLFVLPVVLIVLGFFDVTHGSTKSIAITLIVIGAVAAFGLGLLRGRADKLSDRDGSPFMQWGKISLLLFVGNIVVKLVLDLIGLAAGSPGSAVGKSLLLTFGLTLLGEAVVLRMRTGAATATGPRSPSRATTAEPRRQSADRFAGPVSREPATTPTPTGARSLGDAAQRHHDRHRERHNRHHSHKS